MITEEGHESREKFKESLLLVLKIEECVLNQ